MLDTQNNNYYSSTQTVEIKPACIGTLQKSHPKSYFSYCHKDSEYRKNYVDDNPKVLQIMVFGDDNLLVEILPDEVYEEWINNK